VHVTIAPQDLATAWTFDPPVVAGLVATGWLYARGARRLRSRLRTAQGIAPWRVWAFAGGMFATAVALISPLAAAGGALFSAHMVQHLVLMLIAAPLLVLGAPMRVMLWAFDRPRRRWLGSLGPKPLVHTTWSALTNPIVAWTVHALALWIWHHPYLFQLTLRSEAVHVAQHVSFFGTALLFWWVVAAPGRRQRMHAGLAVLYVFTTAVQSAALGALLTFPSQPLYPEYARGAALWGLTPLEDQQVAGLIMWVPGGVLYLLAALAILAAWFRSAEAEQKRSALDAYRRAPPLATNR
jgi:putative membrane protein